MNQLQNYINLKTNTMIKKYKFEYDYDFEVHFEVDTEKFTEEYAKATLEFFSWNYDDEADPIDEVMKKYALEVVRFSAFSYSSIKYIKNHFINLEGFGRIDGSIGITLVYLVSSELNDDLLEMSIE